MVHTNDTVTIRPGRSFYQTYTPSQIQDIMYSLRDYKEIPLQYHYIGEGAHAWDRYINQVSTEDGTVIKDGRIKLLRLNLRYIKDLTKEFKDINIINLGGGSHLAIKDLLITLGREGKLRKVYALDTSEAMLKIAKKNVEAWTDSKTNFIPITRDIRFDHIRDLTMNVNETYSPTAINLIIASATLYNFRYPDDTIRLISRSMTKNSILLHDMMLDSLKRRGFGLHLGTAQTLSNDHKIVPELLGLRDEYYEVNQYFDGDERARFVKIIPKNDIKIIFRDDTQLILEKARPITIFRYWHKTIFDIMKSLNDANLDILHSTLTEQKDYAQVIARLRTN